jgi:hypothetical protein
MCDLPPAGIGDRWNGISPNANRSGHAVKRQHGPFAGNVRIAVLPAVTGHELGAPMKAN